MTDEELIARLREGATRDDDIAAATRAALKEAKLLRQQKYLGVGEEAARTMDKLMGIYLKNLGAKP